MKKLISTAVAFTLTLSISTTTVFAGTKEWAPPGLAKKGFNFPPGIAKKIFDDLDDFPWAKQAIEKMNLKGLIKGYGDGIFAPRNAVTKLETVIMALRIMGWESEAKDITNLPKKYKGKEVADWAKGYITVAYEKGILDDVDMMYFNPQEPAKRHEVAKYVIRALGYDEEAQRHMDEELPFVDAPAVPQGSVGYVYLSHEMKLMQGDNEKRFNPMGTLTRAEMAVLFQRVDDKVDSEIDEDEIKGEVYRIDEDKITLKIDGQIKSFEIDDDVIAYDEDARINYLDIQLGSTVLLQFEDGEVVYIEIVDENDENDKIITRYTGTVVNINKNTPRTITIQNQKMKLMFEVIDDAEVYFKNIKGSFAEIKADDGVAIVVDNKNRVRVIYVDREREEQNLQEVEGTIQEVKREAIKVKVGNTIQEYRYASIFVVYINGNVSRFSNLEKGMDVELELKNGLVYEINAEDNEFQVEGQIDTITQTNNGYELALEVNNQRFIYKISDNINITIEGAINKEITDLKVGQKGKFEIVNNTIVEITIED
ncbi:MAG: hypothetical protein PWR27_1296 [Petroclostridium sp.]|jgi:gamma-glutamylcyclotransferase (GGCT)/AIG2-like uncharacterized protein YtfP|uniref:S-layer homology domain-containing protein n=1 Tax=Petroclostridium xylanilyticum TaxID=1792311 RepID=UPI000B98ABF9|nr:S-layer homology domain-containing protein [Petroclostridium xylanilyticum]MBZ4646340.1 S-layer domain protein [Clostridia bacterium]MDK2810587.1 hypothetical protein [Petroclostridium sp.]